MEYLPFLASANTYLAKANNHLVTHSPAILNAVLVVAGGYIFYKATAKLFRNVLFRTHVDDAFARLLIDNLYKLIILVIVLITAASQLGINIIAPLAGIGILGLAIGFAAQDSLSNVIAGFLIFFDKPFRVHDYVSIGDHYGRIELITMRSTRIRTPDNMYVVIPNLKIINEVLVDHSTNGDTRLYVPVLIEFEASVHKARTAILDVIREEEGVLLEPAPDVVVDSLDDSGVKLQVRFWIANAADEQYFHYRITERVKDALDGAGIKIAYPHIQMVKEKPVSRIRKMLSQ